MRTVIALGMAALLATAAIVSWATATARSNNHANALAQAGASIDPFELMKSSNNLPHQQWDAF